MSLERVSVLLLAVFLGGCGSEEKARLANPNTAYLAVNGGLQPGGPNTQPDDGSSFDQISYWDGDGVPGQPSVTVNLAEQRAYFYRGDQLVAVSMVSAGREGFNTPPGTFKIIQKDKDHASNLYGDYVDTTGTVVKKDVELGKDPKPPGAIFKGAPMPFFMRITGGVGMHKGYLPGYPASHGCIRMPGKMAEEFFNNVEVGTPVTVIR
jgi:lipoprotein-anchoring transpeptidase ErfK/SrfK